MRAFSLALALGLLLPSLGGEQPDAAKSSWLVRFYRDNAFVAPAGTTLVHCAGINVDVSKFKAEDGRRLTYEIAFAAHGSWTVPADGDYCFRTVEGKRNNGAYRLAVDGRFVNEQPDGKIALRKGSAALTLYSRQRMYHGRLQYNNRNAPVTEAAIEVKAPGGSEFVPVVVAAADPSVLARPDVAYTKEFSLDEAKTRYWSCRTFAFDVPEDGYYRVSLQRTGATMRKYAMVLDDREIANMEFRMGVDASSLFYGEPDLSGDRRKLRADFFSRVAKVRRLEKGRHMLDICLQAGPWHNDRDVSAAFTNGTVRVGVDRLDGLNPASETGFWFENRDDLVYRRGERMVLKAGSAAADAGDYEFEVSNTVTRAIVRRERRRLGRTVTDFTYDCPDEGGFEFRVRDAQGRVVEGPWAFAVVDVTPVRSPKMTRGGRVPPAAERVVDAVCCTEGAEGEHLFRDSFGTSTVVTNGEGLVYRMPGPQGCTSKLLMSVGKPGSVENRRGDMREMTPEERKAGVRPHRWGHYFDWFAYTLTVRHPGRAHVIRCTVPNDASRYVTSYAFDWKTAAYNGANLLTGDAPAAGPVATLSYFVWPNTDKIDVLVPNTTGCLRGGLNGRGAVIRIELLECEDDIPALPEPHAGWQRGRSLGWIGEQGDLWVNERTMPPLWGDDGVLAVGEDTHGYHTWNDMILSWERFGRFSAYRGDSLVTGPVFSYGMQFCQGLAPRLLYPSSDVLGKGSRCPSVDLFGRDHLKLMLLKCEKYGVRFVADFMIYVQQDQGKVWAQALGIDEGLDSIFLSAGADGKPYRGWTSALVNNPAHPAYRKTAVRFCEELSRRYGGYRSFAGIRQRYWHDCVEGFDPWWLNEKLGFDDWTVARFAAERGLGADRRLASVGYDAKAFEARRDYITETHAAAWRAWRDEKVYTLREEMLAALRRHAPQAELFVTSTNVFASKYGLGDARMVGRRDLGYLAGQHRLTRLPSVEIGGLYSGYFTNFNVRPAPYGNPDHGTNVWCISSYPTGLCCNDGYRAAPYLLESAAKALAANRLNHLWAGPEWCLPAADECLRGFVQVFRAIPDLAYARIPAAHGSDTNAPYAAWQAKRPEGGAFAFFVNTTDCRLKVKVALAARNLCVTDAVDGSTEVNVRELAFELPPFMVAARILSDVHGATGVTAQALGEGLGRITAEADRLIGFEDQCGGLTGIRADETRTYSELIAPLKKARADGDSLAMLCFQRAFRRDHDYWYGVTGYPLEERVCTRPSGCTLAWMKERKLWLKAKEPDDGAFGTVEGFGDRTFFLSKRGRGPLVEFGGGWGGYRSVRVTALFGGGYGPLRVEDVDGREVWTFPATGGKIPRLETREVPVPFTYRYSNCQPLRFVAGGARGGAVLSAQVETLPPQFVTKYSLPDGREFRADADGWFLPPAGVTTLRTVAVGGKSGGLTTTFLYGVERADVKLNGKVLVKKADKPPASGRAVVHTNFRSGTNEVELTVHPAPAGQPEPRIRLGFWQTDKVQLPE